MMCRGGCEDPLAIKDGAAAGRVADDVLGLFWDKVTHGARVLGGGDEAVVVSAQGQALVCLNEHAVAETELDNVARSKKRLLVLVLLYGSEVAVVSGDMLAVMVHDARALGGVDKVAVVNKVAVAVVNNAAVMPSSRAFVGFVARDGL